MKIATKTAYLLAALMFVSAALLAPSRPSSVSAESVRKTALRSGTKKVRPKAAKPLHPQLRALELKYRGKQPKKWGAYLPGIIQTFETDNKEIALTFDACGYRKSSFDRSLRKNCSIVSAL